MTQNTDKTIKRLSITIDPDLHKRLKIVAAEEGITVSSLVNEACKEKLERMKK